MPPIGPSPTNTFSKSVVFMLCAPDVPMMTYLDEDEINARAHLRRRSSRYVG